MMLLREHNGKVLRFPACPENRHAEFRLPVAGGTVSPETDTPQETIR